MRIIHLELTIDLFIEDFLNFLRRFIVRKRLCKTIFSNNGTNFIRNEFYELSVLLNSKEHNIKVSDALGRYSIKWHLNSHISVSYERV